jgi:hypothetical protein
MQGYNLLFLIIVSILFLGGGFLIGEWVVVKIRSWWKRRR